MAGSAKGLHDNRKGSEKKNLPRSISARKKENAKKTLITLCAVIGYGGWALFSNLAEDSALAAQTIALRAAIIQGSYAGLLTLVNLVVLETIFLRLNHRLSCRNNIIATLLIATGAQYSLIVPVHWLNATPNILLTLLPGLIIGSCFSTAYLLSLKQKHYPGH